MNKDHLPTKTTFGLLQEVFEDRYDCTNEFDDINERQKQNDVVDIEEIDSMQKLFTL